MHDPAPVGHTGEPSDDAPLGLLLLGGSILGGALIVLFGIARRRRRRPVNRFAPRY